MGVCLCTFLEVILFFFFLARPLSVTSGGGKNTYTYAVAAQEFPVHVKTVEHPDYHKSKSHSLVCERGETNFMLKFA